MLDVSDFEPGDAVVGLEHLLVIRLAALEKSEGAPLISEGAGERHILRAHRALCSWALVRHILGRALRIEYIVLQDTAESREVGLGGSSRGAQSSQRQENR